MVPERMVNMPNNALKRVDFPAPLGPITVVMAARGTSTVVPCRMVVCPYPPTKSFVRRMISVLMSKIRLDYFRVIAYFVRRSNHQHLTFGDDENTMRDFKDKFHIVFDYRKGHAFTIEF